MKPFLKDQVQINKDMISYAKRKICKGKNMVHEFVDLYSPILVMCLFVLYMCVWYVCVCVCMCLCVCVLLYSYIINDVMHTLHADFSYHLKFHHEFLFLIKIKRYQWYS